MLSNKELYLHKDLYKYFIGYNNYNVGIIPLHIKFPQMNAYDKYFDRNSKYMNLLVHGKEILKKDNEILDKIKNLFKKEFDSEPVYNDKYIKTKINLYNMNFYDNKMPKGNERYTCLSVVLLDSIFINSDKKCY